MSATAANNAGHDPHLAHHFHTADQQFQSGKLGIWLFLATEILLFSGLFCAYAVYRASHPEIFVYAHLYLSQTLGATNTIILIFSSFTMASAVHAAQVGSRRWLVALLSLTLLCAAAFLGIKFVEYKDKWEEHLLTGRGYRPTAAPPGALLPGADSGAVGATAGLSSSVDRPQSAALPDKPAVAPAGRTTGPPAIERSTIAPAAIGPRGISPQWLAGETAPPHRA